ncbi:MAG TPA: hypothetical protein VGU46_01215 [Acidobacteriaceae bacterium]|nr:hypothetical protein [Acidobacteriaceae bacterium]
MVVGGYAVGVHAQPRVTKDLDIFIEMSHGNAAAVYSALASFGAPMSDISVEDFLKPTSVVRIGVPPLAVDILQTIDGVTFSDAWDSTIEYLVDDEVATPYISADDLITNKLAAGRLQDLADVEAIRQARGAQTRKLPDG